jgi:AAA family ATP:ADP antiporter
MRDVFLNSEAVMVDRYYPILGALLFPISTLHYIVSELWGTLSVSFLLWGYVNQITPKECAKRYYGVLGLGAQLGPILAGKTVEMVTHGGDGTEESFIASIRNLNYICLIGEIGFAALYAFMCYYVMKLPRFALKPVKKKKSQPKMSVGAAIKYCASDLYVMSLSGIVFAYGFVMVAGELVYKDVVKLSFDHDAEAFSGFKGMESTLAACLSMFLMLFVAHNVIRLFGWTITALLAPAIATLTASLFYILALSSDIFTDEDNTRHPTSYTINVLRYIGLLFVVAVKGTKYASFDPAKELAFLPLSNEEKYKAKAAVDIVGARFGKGCGALFNIFIINWGLGKKETYFTDTLVASFVAVLLVIALWVISDLYIGREKPNRELKRLEADSKLDLQHVTIGGDRDGDTATVELSAQCDAQLEIRTALPTPDASTTDVTVQ